MKRLDKVLFIFCCSMMLALFSWSALHAQTESNSQDSSVDMNDLLMRLETLERIVAEDQAEEDPRELRAFWDRGINFETRDGMFTSRLSGRIHIDTGIMNAEKSLDRFVESNGYDFEDGVEFRRARITMMGELYQRFFYKASYDFAVEDVHFRDVYVGMKGLPWDTILKVGHFREPFTMEGQTMADGLMMLERSLVQALAPRRNTGAGLSGTFLEERMTWAAGLFYNTDEFGEGSGDFDLSPTVRVTGLPWYEGDGALFHIGASYSRREEDDIRLFAFPENIVAPPLIDTDGFPPADLSTHILRLKDGDLYGGETALALGPFSAQAEYVRMDIDPVSGPDPKFSAHYVQAGYFLTGERRPFRCHKGAFGRVTPASDFLTDEGGTGAWEICARYSYLDLDDDGVVFGGELTDYSAGINWFLNPYIRLTFNYIHADLEHEGTADMVIMRVAMDF
ncbi:MAG: OprO/OprP family phosphate-selective porin [Planctomycetota bacterium]